MKAAIINGFIGHFEMFGYIIHYCQKRGITLDIFTENKDSNDWFKVYLALFPHYTKLTFLEFNVSDHTNVKRLLLTKESYDILFITTDDDVQIADTWDIELRKKIICIDHIVMNRKPSIPFENHIATRPFVRNYHKWALPCFPIMNPIEKIASLKPDIHIAIIGGADMNTAILDRLNCSKTIQLHYICRKCVPVKTKHALQMYENIPTSEMMKIIYGCHYVLTDTQNNKLHSAGYSMSASIPLTFSVLSRLIISRVNNTLYKFRTAIEFDIDADTPIVLPDTLDASMIDSICEERGNLIKMLDTHVDEIITRVHPQTAGVSTTV